MLIFTKNHIYIDTLKPKLYRIANNGADTIGCQLLLDYDKLADLAKIWIGFRVYDPSGKLVLSKNTLTKFDKDSTSAIVDCDISWKELNKETDTVEKCKNRIYKVDVVLGHKMITPDQKSITSSQVELY